MKIVLLSWWYKEYCLELANAISKKKDIILMMPSQFKEYCEKNKLKNLKIEYFKKYRMRNPANILSILKIIKRINTYGPDVIHLQDGYPWLSLFFWKLKNYNIVTTLHDPKQHLGEEKFWEIYRDKTTRKYSCRYIIHGEKLKNELHKHIGVEKENIDVIPHGNFNVFFKKMPIKKSKTKRILFFGRIWAYKGLDYLIKSEPLISNKIKDYKIIIAGKGENFDKYEKLIKDKTKYEIYNRYIENKEIPKFFNNCDIVVLPYVEASQSGIIPMAYAYKKAVVATNVGSIPEIVENNKTGILIEPKNVKALANAIVKVLTEQKLRKKIAKAGYLKSKKELSWENIANKTINTYKKCMK